MTDTFKTLLWDVLVKELLQKLFVALPFLSYGPLGALITKVLTYATNGLYDSVKLTVDIEQIVLKNAAHQKEFDRASVELKLIAQQKGSDSEDFKKARLAHQAILAQFVRFGAV